MNLTLFDLDGTLLPFDSDHAFGQFLVEQGWANGADWAARNDQFYADYCAGHLDQAAYIDFATSAWRHRPLAEAQAMRERFMQTVIRPGLHDNARALVRRHQESGDLVALVTATNEFVTAPIAAAFGIEHLIAVELQREPDGRYSGRIDGVPSFQAGKITRVRAWLADLGQRWEDFAETRCYSDSPNDLPLLDAVSHPVATNPSPALEATAQSRGWPVLRLFA
jgi:HAD superfamily hydrolase (TIGR01490 family)